MKTRTMWRHAAVCIAVGALASGFAACGDESDQALTVTLGGNGKTSKFTAPAGADSGLAEITFENESDQPGDMQLIRAEGDHSPQEVVAGLGKAMKGQPFPAWFFAGGGTGVVPPGESATVTQVLEPGTYYPFDTEGGQGPPDPKSVAAIEVSGDASDEELEADTTVSAFEYGFKAEGLAGGKAEIAFENTGAQPHHLLAAELIGDSTAEDVERFFKTEKGKPPLRQESTQATAVIEGGESQLVTLDLKPGRYAFFCFITDRQGGPPHALKGMVDEVEVE